MDLIEEVVTTETTEIKLEGVEYLKLQPGDRLAIRLPAGVDNEEARECGEFLQKHWPEFHPLVFVGEAEIFIVRKEEQRGL